MKKIISYLNPFLILLLVFISFISCSENDEDKIIVNINEFESISDSYPYENINIGASINYWELIYSSDFEEEIVLSSGNKCESIDNQDNCLTEFDSIEKQFGGFGYSCLPSNCFLYIKYQDTNTTSVITRSIELKTFLGDIDAPSDAILLAVSKSYRFSTEKKEIGSIKKTSSGYEILMTKLISDCLPLQVNRFHLEVTRDGLINILGEETYSLQKGACS